MLDFVEIKTEFKKNGSGMVIYPTFLVKHSKDLMVRGKSFYAIWDEENKCWDRDESDARRIIDEYVISQVPKDSFVNPELLENFANGLWEKWQRYIKSFPEHYHELDTKIIFSNAEVQKEDYATKKLSYPLGGEECPCYDKLVTTLYSEEELQKLEWAIGSIINGDSKTIQKFIVLYGGPGTGKSTVLKIIEWLFEDYIAFFESKALGSSSNTFALEPFKNNPLVAIEHDGDLSRIEDNTKLNSIVSHENLVVNEKFKGLYNSRFKCMLFIGTNKPVKITDSKSGILRRLIDVNPTGNKLPTREYNRLMKGIKFELGAIAEHCLKVYESLGPNYYDNYIPLRMMSNTNDLFNFVEDYADYFENQCQGRITLPELWKLYKSYCEDALVKYPLKKRVFKEEMKEYFKEFCERYDANTRSLYIGFIPEKVTGESVGGENDGDLVAVSRTGSYNSGQSDNLWLNLVDLPWSVFDIRFKDQPAQYANENETPSYKWDNVRTILGDLDTRRVHYVKLDPDYIVIDFDLRDENGEKSLEENLKAAESFPKTYAETSKSGGGLHLIYKYDGDVDSLSRVYSDGIEIKTFKGNSSLRRKLYLCNDCEIAEISSGLPLREVKKMLQGNVVRTENGLRRQIIRNLRKEIWPNTKPSMNMIKKILDDAYEGGMKYDVTDMRNDILNFAMNSTNQSDYCMKLINKMKFKSDEPSENVEAYRPDTPIIFFDVEVFPNLFVVCWKKQGEDGSVVKWINPTIAQINSLFDFRLVGFNNRDYDNHILYAASKGYSVEALYRLSQRIIADKDKTAKFGEAYNLSYTDIYDYSSEKMSLKKWEIRLKIHHDELGYPWDEPVSEDKWERVAEYCGYDVIATEAVFNATVEDFDARLILADLAGMTANDTTNSLTTRIIVGKDKDPQLQFIHPDLSEIFPGYRFDKFGIPKEEYNEGTKIPSGKSIYRGEDPSEGGKVDAFPGIYENVGVLDIASMHPHSAIKLKVFGEEYTKRFAELVNARILIKHKDYDSARKVMDGKLAKYLDDPSKAKKLSKALKIPINSVYGLTSAKFPNKLRDPNNEDNVVAKYGALFMINLKHECLDRGWTVVHIKTDSIKLANITQEMIDFVMDYGKQYGFTFEMEDMYSKMCLVNESTYIAKYKEPKVDEETGKVIKWTATGTQFQVPYVFKTLFSKEPIEFNDVCETKSVTTALYLDFDEKLQDYPEDDPKRHDYRFVGKVGLFTPVKDGFNGGRLLRQNVNTGGYDSVVGTKKPNGKDVYRWLESETIEKLGNYETMVDEDYYIRLVNDAVDTISEYGDFERFVSDDEWMQIPPEVKEDEYPFDYMNEPVAS